MTEENIVMEVFRACIDMRDASGRRSTVLCDICGKTITPYIISKIEEYLDPICEDDIEKVLCYKYIACMLIDHIDIRFT